MMKLSNKRLFLATILMASFGYTAVASAQTTTPAPDSIKDKMHRGDHSNIRDRMFGNHQEHAAKRQAGLKAALKITPEQEAAWATYTASMQPPANMAGGMMGMRHDTKVHADMAKLTTPERIDKLRALRAERMTMMNAEMDKRGAATKAFYAVLSSEQKTVFDSMAIHHGRHGEHGKKGGHGHMGHHS
jgi:periplasmic protein CpxP/Spy